MTMTNNERILEVVRGMGGEKVSTPRLVAGLVEAGLIDRGLSPHAMTERGKRLIRAYNRWCLDTGRLQHALISFRRSKGGKTTVDLPSQGV